MTPAPLRPFLKKSTPAPLPLSKFVKTPAGVHSDTPDPVLLWFRLLRVRESDRLAVCVSRGGNHLWHQSAKKMQWHRGATVPMYNLAPVPALAE